MKAPRDLLSTVLAVARNWLKRQRDIFVGNATTRTCTGGTLLILDVHIVAKDLLEQRDMLMLLLRGDMSVSFAGIVAMRRTYGKGGKE